MGDQGKDGQKMSKNGVVDGSEQNGDEETGMVAIGNSGAVDLTSLGRYFSTAKLVFKSIKDVYFEFSYCTTCTCRKMI